MGFEELGRDADEETIKTAYRRLAKFYHPDGWFIHLSVFLVISNSPTVFKHYLILLVFPDINLHAPVNMT